MHAGATAKAFGSVNEWLRRRWKRYAYLGRYGHQSIVEILGRPMTALEVEYFARGLNELLSEEHEVVDRHTD